MSTTKRSTVLAVCILGVLLGMMFVLGQHSVITANAAGSSAKAEREALISIQNAFTAIAEEIKPAVVFITAERAVTSASSPSFEFFRGWPFDDLFPFRSPIPRNQEKLYTKAAGSGVIIKSDKNVSYIVTNDHVVAGADRVTVKLDDDREFVGQVTRDPRTDLAVVKIDVGNLPTAKLADSDAVKVGQWAIAIGSPFQLTNSLTVGVVSAVMREAVVPDASGGRLYPDLIQTDASINPGNSGGPLVNINGEIIGINSMIESPTGANAGIGFAVPSNTVKFVVEQLIDTGKVVRGYLGVGNKDITPAAAKTLGVEKGALVESVAEDSPAEKAGIKPMDVIVEVNGKKIDNALSLRRTIQPIKPGTVVPVVIMRDGKRLTLQIKIAEVPEDATVISSGKPAKLGLSVQELTSDLIKKLGVPEGTKGVMVQSVEAGTPAGRARPPIQVGDIIIRINNQRITSVAQFNSVVSKLKSGDTALFVIQRRNTTAISEITLD